MQVLVNYKFLAELTFAIELRRVYLCSPRGQVLLFAYFTSDLVEPDAARNLTQTPATATKPISLQERGYTFSSS